MRWYYHGIQELNKFTIPFTIIRFAGVLFTFIIVNDANDWYKVIIITVIFPFLSVIYSWALYFKSHKIKYVSFKYVYKLFTDSSSLFITNLVSVIKDRSGGIFISFLLGPSSLVLYEFCIKIVGVISSLASSVSAALYPSFSKNINPYIFMKVNNYIIALSLIPVIITFIAPDILVEIFLTLFKLNLSPIIILFPIFGLMVFVRSHGYYLGLCYLMAKNKKKRYASSLIISGLLYIMFMTLMLVFDCKELSVLVIIIGISLIVEYLHRLYMCLKTRKEMCEN